MTVLVTTSTEAAARDAVAIAALTARGGTGFDLMLRAGRAATSHIVRVAESRGADRVAVYVGPGNNGGDGWVVAHALRDAGLRVRVHVAAPPRTPDARMAARDAIATARFPAPDGSEPLVVDALLGTGGRGAPDDVIAAAIAAIATARGGGAYVIALDVPSGLDATVGTDQGAVTADETLSFGTLKRGLLVARERTGAITVLDIGVSEADPVGDTALPLLDVAAVQASVPPISASAHKGSRGRVVIVGGAPGMAGAVILACRAALRSGAGLVYGMVAAESRTAVQCAVPQALAPTWDEPVPQVDVAVLGPGLGRDARPRVEHWLAALPGDTRLVLDADALNAFAGDGAALRAACVGRMVIITPHVAECARLLGCTTAAVLDQRFGIGRELAAATGAVVVLKGTPTVISAPDGDVCVAAVGSPVLATGGSGDLLAGVLAALWAVMPAPMAAARAAVWAHGTAAERAATTAIRGTLLDAVERELAYVWQATTAPLLPGELAVLPAVGEC